MSVASDVSRAALSMLNSYSTGIEKLRRRLLRSKVVVSVEVRAEVGRTSDVIDAPVCNPGAHVRRPKQDYESSTLGLDRNELALSWSKSARPVDATTLWRRCWP